MPHRTRPLLAAIVVSAFLTLPAGPNAFFNLLTVPLLIHYSTLTTTATFLKHVVLILAPASALRSAPTSLKLVPSAVEALVIQAAFSCALAVAIALPIEADLTLGKKLSLSGLTAAGDFGLVWAATWWMWETLSPVGRYGVPSPLPQFAPVAFAVRIAGATGLDILTGCLSYACYQFGSTAVSGLLWLPPSADETADLITLENDPDPQTSQSDEEAGLRSNIGASTNPPGVHPLAFLKPLAPFFAILAGVALPWLPAPLSLSAPLAEVMPVTVACVLGPPYQTAPKELIRESLRVPTDATVIIWPESALRVDSKASRSEILSAVAEELAQPREVMVAVGIDSPTYEDEWKNEVALLGPGGVVGKYTKQHLFPAVQSLIFDREGQTPPTWEIPVRRPSTAPDDEWAPRNISAAPLIGIDTYHTSLLRSQRKSTPAPALLLIPSAFETLDLGRLALDQIRLLAISHNTPALVCSRSSSGAGGTPAAAFAAFVDQWGRILHMQVGGPSAVFTVPLASYAKGKSRKRTVWERLGPIGIWDITLLVLFPAQAATVLKFVVKLKGLPFPEGLQSAGDRAGHIVGTRSGERERVERAQRAEQAQQAERIARGDAQLI